MLRQRDGGGLSRARWTLAVLAAGPALLGSTAQAQTLGDGGFEPTASPAEVREYWTPERMRSAIPFGEPAAATPAKAGGTIAKRVRNVKRAPIRTHGKAFFTLGGLDYVCSATSVRSPGESLVWTAAHCVYEPGLTGGFATNWEFVPAYRSGRSPFGEWAGKSLQTTPQWKDSGTICPPGISICGDVRHDFGAVTVSKRGGRTLQDTVGGRGIVFGGPRDQVYTPFGYPADEPFNGERMYRCRSPYKGADRSSGSPAPMRIRCDMTGGSSGGGWVTSSGDVASVVSYGYADEPNNLYGPYQAGSAHKLYDKVKSG